MSEKAEQLKKRTFEFAVSIVNLVRALPATFEGRRVGGQLFDAGTSVAANDRAACKARSHAEFIAKIGIVLEEADESEFWLDFLVATSIVPEAMVKSHPQDSDVSQTTALNSHINGQSSIENVAMQASFKRQSRVGVWKSASVLRPA